eukprot:TRINITY_DN1808_c1_g1_i2.p1 TRINITY_DN1808_c1_g1~~TRINITY_DN1808_c1_g1_i2.p1  ORF type:complete len:139 (-),score=42.39 TRINITY_DN1808_c1_g1_i2:18-434(-)
MVVSNNDTAWYCSKGEKKKEKKERREESRDEKRERSATVFGEKAESKGRLEVTENRKKGLSLHLSHNRIGNLAVNASKDDLEKKLGGHVVCLKQSLTNLSFAIIEFRSIKEAEEVRVYWNQKELFGNRLVVKPQNLRK